MGQVCGTYRDMGLTKALTSLCIGAVSPEHSCSYTQSKEVDEDSDKKLVPYLHWFNVDATYTRFIYLF